MSERAPRTSRLTQNVPAVTILATTVTEIGEAPESGVVSSVSYTPVADITGAASPASRTLTLINKGQDGNGAVAVATLAFLGGINASDFDEKQFTLGVAGNLVIVAGDILAVSSAPVGGTGLVDPGGLIQVEISRA